MQPPDTAPDTEQPEWRKGWVRRHIRTYQRQTPRRAEPPIRVHVRSTAARRLMLALFPWEKNDYPGRIAAVTEILGEPVLPRTLQSWQDGTHPMPLGLLRRLADFGRSRREHLAAALAEIEAEIAERERQPLRAGGWRVVGPGGTNQRGARGSFEADDSE